MYLSSPWLVHWRRPVPLTRLQTGPRDIQKHSKWPIFLQMHGSILPKLIVPLLAVAGWASWITCLNELVDGVKRMPPPALPTCSRVQS